MRFHWLLSLAGLCSGLPPVKPDPNSRFLNHESSQYLVNGTGIPDINFDIGESYAGLMPIGRNKNNKNESDSLYFWFFPTATEEFRAKNEIVIWLSGGPGCSSLSALTQENGPFLWRPGMKEPQKNPWSFNLLTNVVWVEQPLGTGFSKGKPTVTNEDELAKQFLGFWFNFMNTFDIKKYNIYIAAESYGGMYGPYIAKQFIKDPNYTFKGLLIYDGVMFDRHIQTNVVAGSFIDMHRDILAVDDATRRQWHDLADECNFTSYEKQHLQYPSSGPLPAHLPGYDDGGGGFSFPRRACAKFYGTVFDRMVKFNPCISVYNILSKCPPQFDFTNGNDGPWFDREDVKKAINAPLDAKWVACKRQVFGKARDESLPSGKGALPFVIEETKNVILAHGAMDFALPMNGVLLGIQSMTWGGMRGFRRAPSSPFIVPQYHTDGPAASDYARNLPSGTGIVGTTHHERGLTFVVTELAGHEGPGDSPAAALRHLERLTGQVESLSSHEPFTLPEIRNVTQTPFPEARGIVPIPCFGWGC